MVNRYIFVKMLIILSLLLLLGGSLLAQGLRIENAHVRGRGGREITLNRPASPTDDWWYSTDVECIHDVGCVDIVFCVDTSGSMSGTIGSLQDEIDRFAYDIAAVGFDYSFGLVTYCETVNFPHGATLVDDLGAFSAILDEARGGDGGWEEHGQAIYDAVRDFDWRPGCEHIVILVSDECDDASAVAPSTIISQLLSWGGTIYMMTADCGDVDEFRMYCDTTYGMWFDYGSSTLNDVFEQIVDDIAEVVEIDITVTNTSGGSINPMTATLIPDFCITVGDSPNPQPFGPVADGASHTFVWDITEIPGCAGWGDCFIIRVEGGGYTDSIVGCLWVEDCGCPGPDVVITCPEFSGNWSACDYQQIEMEFTGYMGVNENTICIRVNGTEYCYPHPNLTWSPSGSGGVMTFTPSTPWAHLSEVDIEITDGLDMTNCPIRYYPESDFHVDLEPPHVGWWEHHDATWWPPAPAWREWHDSEIAWSPACGETLDGTDHITLSALVFDDGVGVTPVDLILSDLESVPGFDFGTIWSSLTSIQLTVNGIPFIPGAPIPGAFNRSIDFDLSYILSGDQFGGWLVTASIRADSAFMLGLFSPEIEICLEAHDIVAAEGCMPCENDTQWCCTFWLLEDIPLTANAGPDQYICSGDAVIIGGSPAAAGGTTPYNYSWSPATGLSNPNIANPTASPTTTTTYTLTVTDGVSDVATDNMTVYVSNPIADAGDDDTLCAGTHITLGGSPTGSGGFAPLSYSWQPAGLISTPTLANPMLMTDMGWSDTTIICIVTVTDTLGCEDVDTVIITIDNIEPDAGPDQRVCLGEAVTLGGSPTASGGIPPYTYNWYEYPGGALVSTDPNPVVTPSTTTTYVVQINGGEPYCIATDTCIVYTVEVFADAGEDQSLCVGGSVGIGGSPTGSGSGGYIYSWTSVPPGFSSSESNPLVSPSEDTRYIVTVTDSVGCTDVDTVLVEAFPSPFGWVAVPEFCGGVSSCEYQSVIWTIIDTVGMINEATIRVSADGDIYTVSDPEVTTTTHLGDSISIMFSPETPWTHGDTIVFELENVASYAGCSTFVEACSFIVDLEPPIADPLVPPDGSIIYIEPDSVGAYIEDFPAGIDPLSFNYISVTVNGLPATGWTHSWSDGYLGINNLVLSDGDSVVICLDSLFDDPDYDYCAHNDTSLCWWFMIMPCDVEVTASPDTVICGSGDIVLNADVVGGSGFFTYEWTPDVGLDNPTLPNPTATIESTITYVVEVYDESLMCSAYDTATIITSNPIANAGPDGIICPFSSVPLGCNPAVTGGLPPYSFEWMDSTGAVLYTDENPLHTFGDSDEWFLLHVIDSLGCEDWDTVNFTIDWEEMISFELLTPTPDETLAVGGVYFEWEVTPGSGYVYDFLLDDAVVFDHIDSTHVTLDFPCGESHNWTIVAWKECFHEYVACGETTITAFTDSVSHPFDPPFHMEPCGEPYAVEVHVPDGDWTACDPDSIVAFIIDSVGIFESSIVMTVNGTEYTTADPELTWDGDSTLVFRPGTMWADGDIIDVCVDSAMNLDSMPLIAPVCWEFYIDRSAPEIVSISPAPFSEIPTTVESIQVCIRDDLSGLDSLIMDVDGVLYELGPYGCVDTTVCEWFPVGPLSPGDIVDVYLVRATDCPDWCGPNVLDSVWDYLVSDCDVEISFDLGVAETLICHPDSMPVVFELTTTVTGGTAPFTYWNSMEGIVGPTHVGDPTYHLDHSTLISIIVVDADSCLDTASFVVYISDLEANAGPDLEICEGDTVQIGRLAYWWDGPFIGAIDYWWTYEDGTFLSDELNPLVWPDVTTSYVFHVSDSAGCEDTDTMTVIRNHESPGTFTGLYPPPDAMLPPGDITIIWSDAGGVPPANYHLIIDGVDTVAMGISDTFFTVNYPCGHTHSWEVIAYNLCASEMVVSSSPWGGDSIGYEIPPDTFYGGIDTSAYDPIFHTFPCEGPSAVYSHVPSGDWTACDPDSIVWTLDDSVTYIESTIEVVVNGVVYSTSDGELSWDGSEYLIFRPSPMWASGTTVRACLVSVMSEDSLWLPDSVCGEFYIDFDPPEIWSIIPASGTVLPATSMDYIQLLIFDFLSGLDESSVTIDVGPYGFELTDPEIVWDGDSAITLDIRAYDFECGDTIDICVYAEDSPDWCGPNVLDTCWTLITSPCGLNAVIIEPLPNTISACEDQEIVMEIHSGDTTSSSRSVLWITDNTYSSGRLTDGGSIGYLHVAESLAVWGWDIDEIYQTVVLTPSLLEPYDVVVIGNIKSNGPRTYTAPERTALTDYVANGGQILAISGWVVEDYDIITENFLLNDIGINFEPYEDWTSFVSPEPGSPIEPGVTQVPGNGCKWVIGLDECWAYRGSDCACGVKYYGSGKVVAYFDEHWLFNGPWHSMDFTTHQNATLFRNIFSYLAPTLDSSLCPVDPSSIVLQVEGVDYTLADSELDWSDPVLTWTPPADWVHGTSVEVCLTAAEDSCGGEADGLPICWEFDIDLEPPALASWNPPCSSAVNPSSGVDFDISLEDGPADIGSVWVSVDGVDYNLGSALTISGSDADFVWNPVTDGGISLIPGSSFEFCVHASDTNIDYCETHDTVYCCEYFVTADTGVVTGIIIEPLPNTITTCDDQAIVMEIMGSEGSVNNIDILWMSDYGFADNCRINSYSDRGYGAARDSVLEWGYSSATEIPETTEITLSLLSGYSLFVLGGLVDRDFSTSEVAAIEEFVDNGGSLLEICGGYPLMHLDGIRDALSPFGISVSDPLLPDVFLTTFVSHPITEGLESLCTEGAYEFSALPPATELIFDDASRAHCAISEFGSGRVAVFSDEQFLWTGPISLPYTYLYHVDNLIFANNLFTWLFNPSLDSTDCAIDPSSIILRVEGTDYTVADTELDWTPNQLTFTPSVLWTHGQVVDVCLVQAEDSCGAVLEDSICWQFTADLEPPELASIVPACGSPIIPLINDHWDITLIDIPAGVMPDSTFVILGDDTCHIAGGGGDTMTFTFDPDDYGITLVAGDTVTLCIATMDGPVDYCEPNDTIYCCDYPIFPSEGPIAFPIRVPPDSISACEPESIIIEITSEFEVVESTIVLNVDGLYYRTSASQLTWFDPFLTYLPTPDWNPHDTVFVQLVSARDIFDNQYVNYPLEWVFYIDRVEPQSAMIEPPDFTRDIMHQIVIVLTDSLAGVNPSSLILEVEGEEYFYPDDFDWDPEGLGGSLVWNPVLHGVEYNAGDTIEVQVYAEDDPDLCGPNEHLADYSFIVEPWTPCAINPNPFSPNGDAFNEITAFDWPNMTTEGAVIHIFDIRNTPVRKMDIEPQRNYLDYPARAWDGRDNEGKLMPQGLYLYVVESDGRIVCNGTITLVR